MALEYKAGQDTYAQVQQAAVCSAPAAKPQTPQAAPAPQTAKDSAAPSEMSGPTGQEFPLINFPLLMETNADTVGYVYIEGTNINYPVVQGEDNRYYVSTMFDGSVNQAGSIFMDSRNSADMSDAHTILYGHNMRDKSMFADILNYQQQEYLDAHPVGFYITPEANYRFHIVAAYIASLADPAWQLEFTDEENLLEWLDMSIEKSTARGSLVPKAGDKIITLSTCTYEFADARFVLLGILEYCGPPAAG